MPAEIEVISAAPRRSRADLLLMLPAFGLMVLGFASTVVNVWNSVRYLREPAAARRDATALLGKLKGEKEPEKPDDEPARDREVADRAAQYLRVLVPMFAVVSGLEFYGGLAIVLRRHYRMAQLGCVLAALNLANGCCVPGAIVGLGGLLALLSEEGRDHFVR